MKKSLKNRRALSLIVVSFILIVASIAVSIAVCELLPKSPEVIIGGGPLETFSVNSMTFFGTSGTANTNYINMTIQNTSSSRTCWTLTNAAKVNSVSGLTVTSIGNRGALNCTGGNSIRISIMMNPGWVSGNQYNVTLLLTDGNQIPFYAQAP
jgi:hypothetical protein